MVNESLRSNGGRLGLATEQGMGAGNALSGVQVQPYKFPCPRCPAEYKKLVDLFEHSKTHQTRKSRPPVEVGPWWGRS